MPNLMQDGSTRADRSHHGTPIGHGHDRLPGGDIADMHALTRAEYLKLAWADPTNGEVDFTALPECELAVSTVPYLRLCFAAAVKSQPGGAASAYPSTLPRRQLVLVAATCLNPVA